ncbi:protein kinase domain-containing protein [Streptomyces sp. NPDC054796]
MGSEDTGRLVGGRYRLGEVLGRGGMGTVWRGRDEILGRTVAVKELRFPSSVDEDEKQRLITRTLREAKAIARIRSGSAVTVFDVVDEDDRPWIVMELVEGSSLADHIRQDGPLTPQRAAEVGLAILDVLRAAHREGILHRDVKPSNVLLEDGTGRVVLTDFGIAKVEGDPSVTSTGMLVGAPSYISPERARGKPPGPPADLWSLGGLLYAAVEGHPPYDKGSAISTLTAVMTEPVPPTERAGELSEAIYGLLIKDPAKRLDVDGARVLLEPVAYGAKGASAVAEPSDATRTTVLPSPPDEDGPAASGEGRGKAPWSGKGSGKGTGRSGKGSWTGKAAAAGAAAGAAAASATKKKAAKPASSASGAGAGAGAGSGAGTGKGGAGAKSPASAKGSGAAGAGAAGGAGGRFAPGRGRQLPEEAPAASSASASRAGARTASAAGAGSGTGGGAGGSTSAALASLTERFSRRTLLVAAAAVVAVLVLLGAVLVNASGEEGGGSAGQETGASSGAAAGQNEKTDGGKSEDKGADEDKKKEDGGKSSPSTSPESSPSKDEDKDDESGKPSLPDGYENVEDDQFHFSMAMPGDMEKAGIAGQNSGRKYATGGSGLPKIQVDYNPKPTSDAAAAWRSLEGAVKGNSPSYHRIGIEKVSWRGYPTVADWQFTRTEGGTKVRVLNRGFKVDSTHGYAIMVTCKASGWDEKKCRDLRETAFKTFKVAD